MSLRQQFEGVRSSREGLFLRAFNHISKGIDDIYKDLTQVEGVPLGGTAYLALEDPPAPSNPNPNPNPSPSPSPNPEPNPSPKQDPTDPFLHGITYHAMPPSKRFRAMSDLSTPTPSRTLSRTIPLDPNPNPGPNPEPGPKH